jgi:hypothetical protein
MAVFPRLAAEKKVKGILGVLSASLESKGYLRSGVVFRRRRPSSVVDIVEIARVHNVIGVTVGICFPEVVEFARSQGDNCYLYVGDLPKSSNELLARSAQLVQDLGKFGDPQGDLRLSDKEVGTPHVCALVATALAGSFHAKVERAGQREEWIDNWEVNIVDPMVSVEALKAFVEQRKVNSHVQSMIEDWHRRSWAADFICWGSPTITAAIVANHLGRKATVKAILDREIDGYGSYKPQYVAHLAEIRTLLA